MPDESIVESAIANAADSLADSDDDLFHAAKVVRGDGSWSISLYSVFGKRFKTCNSRAN